MIPQLRLTQDFHRIEYGMKPGRWFLYGPEQDQRRDIGERLVTNWIAIRVKAIEVSERGCNNSRPKRLSYDPASLVYRDIERRSADNSYCMEGYEHLIYIHGHGLATYFISSRTGKAAWNKMERRHIRHCVEMTAQLNRPTSTAHTFTWYSPVFDRTEFTWQDYEKYRKEIDEFCSAKAEEPLRTLMQGNTLVDPKLGNLTARIHRELQEMFDELREQGYEKVLLNAVGRKMLSSFDTAVEYGIAG